MPKEKFYLSGQIEGDGNPPDFAVSWGTDHEGDSTTLISGPDEKPYIIAKPNDTAGLSRLIKALTRARTHMVQNRGAQPLVEVPDFLKVDHTKPKPRPAFSPADSVRALRTGMVKGRKVQAGHTYLVEEYDAGAGVLRTDQTFDSWFPTEWFVKTAPVVELIDNGPDQIPTHWAMALPEGVSVEEHEHNPVQHRDGKPPWCRACGLTADWKVPESRFEKRDHESRLRQRVSNATAEELADAPADDD